MDEIKISRALEKQIKKEEEDKIGEALQEEGGAGEGKSILVMVGVLIGVLLFSWGGFKAYEHFTGAEVVDVDELHQKNLEEELAKEEGYLYNGYSFVFADGLWWTEMKKGRVLLKVPLHFGPREVEIVTVAGSLSSEFNKGEEVYIAIDPEFANKYYSLALSELNFNLVKGIERKPVAVCTEESYICEEREILNCENSQGKPVIELRWGGEPKITLNETCILISGEEENLVKAADRLIWQWYGVM